MRPEDFLEFLFSSSSLSSDEDDEEEDDDELLSELPLDSELGLAGASAIIGSSEYPKRIKHENCRKNVSHSVLSLTSQNV